LKPQIDLNCDLGESYGAFKVGDDEKIMPYITSANVACGFHAGDPVVIERTIDLAKKHRVAIGAHPGYPDLLGFGRREIQLTPEEVKDYMIYQVSAIQGFARIADAKLQHVKPHGALYNTAVKDEKLSTAITDAVKALNSNLIIYAPHNSALAQATAKNGLRVAYETFADRAYNSDGSLVSRKQQNAVIQDPHEVVERAVQMVEKGTVLAVDGELVNLGKVHTICVHGDTPTAVELAKTLKKGLTKAGISVQPAESFV
jgi:UPF0271 protein